MVKKFSISLPEESLAQLDYIRQKLRLHPNIKFSNLIQQVIFDEFSKLNIYKHGFPDCDEDCNMCPDEPICDYSNVSDGFMV